MAVSPDGIDPMKNSRMAGRKGRSRQPPTLPAASAQARQHTVRSPALKGHGLTASEKIRFFEKAWLQPCHKDCKMNSALAAEGWFSSDAGLFLQTVEPRRQRP
jgi:hypothetical protein